MVRSPGPVGCERMGEERLGIARANARKDTGVGATSTEEARILGVECDEGRLRVAEPSRPANAWRDRREVAGPALRRVAEDTIAGHERVELRIGGPMESRVRREDHARTGRIHVRRVEPVRVARVDGEDTDAAGLSVVVVDARPRSAGRDTGVPPELIAAEAHRPLVADAGLDVESRRTRPARGVGDADRTGIRRATGQLCPDDGVRRDVRRDVDATRREDLVLLICETREDRSLPPFDETSLRQTLPERG